MAAFEYSYRETPIHKLNPVSKLLLFGLFLVLGGIWLDPMIKLPMLLILIAILAVARLPFKSYRVIILLAVVGIMIGESYTAILMVNPEYFKVYSPEFTSVELFQILPPGFPIFGRAAVTFGALLWWTSSPLTIVTVILSVAGLLHTTTLSDIVSVMSKLKMPFPAIFMMTVALRFVPELVSRIRIVQRAQSLRGWTSDTKNPIKRIRLLAPLLIPVTRYVTRSVDVMTMSSANRAFGLGKVTAVQSFEFDTLDLAISIAAGALIVVGLVLTFTINFGTL
jgi:energy-coupling factor transport system permease protein